MQISERAPQTARVSVGQVSLQVPVTEAAPKADVVEINSAAPPAPPSKPTWTPAPAKEKSVAQKIFGGKAAVIAGGLAVGAGAAAAGAMGGIVGAVAGGIGGAALGLTAVVGLGAAAFVGIAKESPLLAVALLIAGTVVAAAASPFLIGGAAVGAVAIGALCTAGGTAAGAIAGAGGAIIGASIVSSAQKSIR